MPRPPNTINLSAPNASVLWDAVESLGGNAYPASEAITPGHIVQLVDTGASVPEWRKLTTSPFGFIHISFAVAMERPQSNQDPFADYAIGESVPVRWYARGGVFLGLTEPGDFVVSGRGLKVSATTPGHVTDTFATIETPTLVALDTILFPAAATAQRIRVAVVG